MLEDCKNYLQKALTNCPLDNKYEELRFRINQAIQSTHSVTKKEIRREKAKQEMIFPHPSHSLNLIDKMIAEEQAKLIKTKPIKLLHD